MISTKIINKSNNPLPHYATVGSAGMDIYAFLEQPIEIAPFERVLISTGLYIELPQGYEAQLRARSGIALKKGLILPNAPATIDSDYRGEVKVILANISNKIQTVAPGDRIAQMIVARHEIVTWQIQEELSNTKRDKDGFGSTGI